MKPLNSPRIVAQPALPTLAAPVAPQKVTSLPLPLKPKALPVPTQSRAQKLSARLGALVDRIERIKERFTSNGVNAPPPQPANDPLPETSAASSWEAGDPGSEELSLDALEKRVARLARGK